MFGWLLIQLYLDWDDQAGIVFASLAPDCCRVELCLANTYLAESDIGLFHDHKTISSSCFLNRLNWHHPDVFQEMFDLLLQQGRLLKDTYPGSASILC